MRIRLNQWMTHSWLKELKVGERALHKHNLATPSLRWTCLGSWCFIQSLGTTSPWNSLCQSGFSSRHASKEAAELSLSESEWTTENLSDLLIRVGEIASIINDRRTSFHRNTIKWAEQREKKSPEFTSCKKFRSGKSDLSTGTGLHSHLFQERQCRLLQRATFAACSSEFL